MWRAARASEGGERAATLRLPGNLKEQGAPPPRHCPRRQGGRPGSPRPAGLGAALTRYFGHPPPFIIEWLGPP